MQVSYMRLRLDRWYGQLSKRGRIARMYAPQVTPAQAKHFTTDAESDPNLIGQAISRHGVIGHSQTSARARRHGKPIIKRDFNTVDGGINEFMFVLKRANYIIPSRAQRSFPLLPGREQAISPPAASA